MASPSCIYIINIPCRYVKCFYPLLLVQDTRTGAAEHAVPVCSILNSDFSLILVFASLPLAGSVQHGQRLACPLGNLNPPRFSPGRPHCVILWLDGSARCPLPLTAQAGAARLLGILPVAPGQRVPYAYTDLFGFQGADDK